MREHKRILLWCEREDVAAPLAFVLDTQPNFRVQKTDTDGFPKVLRGDPLLDLVLLFDTGNHSLTRVLADTAAHEQGLESVPLLAVELVRCHELLDVPEANRVLQYGTKMADLIETINSLTRRRRNSKIFTPVSRIEEVA